MTPESVCIVRHARESPRQLVEVFWEYYAMVALVLRLAEEDAPEPQLPAVADPFA